MDRKSDSKSNLNDSVLPLLDEEAKEKIELKAKDAGDGAEETNTDATKDDAVDAAKKKKEEEKERKRQKKLEEEEKKKQQKLEKQKKKEEEKELKKQKKAEKQAALDAAKANGTVTGNEENQGKRWSLYNQFTVGLNLLDRDEKSINEHVNVSFEDLIGEPDATQGFEAAYRLSFGLFQFVRFWVYRVLMAVLAVPLALLWALVFAFISLVWVWVLTPGLRVFELGFYFFYRVWNSFVRTLLDPVFSSIALVRQGEAKPWYHIPVATTSGRSTVYNQGVKYNKLASNETMETYKTSPDQDGNDVTLTIDN